MNDSYIKIRIDIGQEINRLYIKDCSIDWCRIINGYFLIVPFFIKGSAH